MRVLAVVIATYAAAQAAPGLRGAPLDAASTSETADQGRVGAEIKSSRAIAAMAHDPSDDASLLRPALEFMMAAGTKGEPDEEVDDGAEYQDDYADILVEETEDRYKDILDSKVTSLAVNGCPDDRLTYPNVWFPLPFGTFDPTKAPEMTGSWYYTVCGDPVWTELGECKWRLDAKLAKGHTVENGLKEGLEEECKNNFAWDHVIIDGAPGHYRLYSNDHGKFVLDDMFPDWN